MSQANQDEVHTRELALGTAIILLEIASSDDQLDKFERSIIHGGLKGLFGVSDETSTAIIDEGRNHLRNMRGSSAAAEFLKDSINPSLKYAIGKLMDDIIKAHGDPQGFQIYMRNRFRNIMQLPEETLQITPEKVVNEE